MFIYTEEDTESDKRIQNKKLYYKKHHQYKDTFQKFIFQKRKIHIFQKNKLEMISVLCWFVWHYLYDSWNSPPPSVETLQHRETPSGLDFRFVYVFRCLNFSVLAVQMSKNTWCVVLWLRRKPRETLRGLAFQNPMEKHGKQWQKRAVCVLGA